MNIVVERGTPTDEELAALTVVLAAVLAARAGAEERTRSRAQAWLRPVGIDYPSPRSWRTAA
ncbi:acyl-CoA carboxylase epsilon subunit [Kitasatospora sp. NPDC048540]|uniref:acyl-CoA carboxylase epsilon subunit n=1 Tax=unclassified Kitasatospora TaxID=2633591 RepID=UPI000539CF57|nr:acyl-CoA carboxylase epsilon subunit [Kitasatospora sp. MBT63]